MLFVLEFGLETSPAAPSPMSNMKNAHISFQPIELSEEESEFSFQKASFSSFLASSSALNLGRSSYSSASDTSSESGRLVSSLK